MPVLYNTQTRKPENVSEDQLEQSILSGTHAYQANDKVNVLDAQGKSYSLPATELTDALGTGEYKLELPRQQAVREYVRDNKGVSGQVKTAVTQFADEALMGIPEIIYDKTADSLEVAKKEALKKENAISNAIGGVGGFAASLIYGGPVGKTAVLATTAGTKAVAGRLAAAGVEKGAQSIAKDLAKRVAKNSIQMGVEGATFAAPVAITEAALGDPELAAETLLTGGLAGLAFGAGGTAIKGISKLTAKQIGMLDEAGSFSGAFTKFKNEKAAKALGFSKGQIKKLQKGQAEAEDIGEELLKLRTSDGRKIIGAFDGPEQLATNVKKAKSEVGERIGEIYKKVDDTGSMQFDANAVKEKIDEKLGSFFKSALNKDEISVFKNAMQALDDVAQVEGLTTLARGRELLDQLDNIAFPGGKTPLSPTPKQDLAKQMRRIVRDELNAGAERGASLLGEAGAAAKLKADNALFGKLIKAERAIDDRVSSAMGNKTFGLTDTIAAAGTAGTLGIPQAAAVLAGKRVAEKYGNAALANIDGLLFVEKAMKKIATAVDEIPKKMDKFVDKSHARPSVKTTSVGAISRMLENADTTLDKIAAFEDLSTKIAEVNSNPAMATDRISQATKPLAETGAANTADQVAVKSALISKYLLDHMPKPLTPPSPFKKIKWTPTDAEISKFERRIHAIQDPLSIVDDLTNGTLTPEAVDAVKTVYPKLFQKIQSKVYDYFMSGEQKNVNYNDRIKLSLLLEMPLDNDLKPENIKNLQETFLKPDQEAQMRTGASVNMPSMDTEVGRISGQ